MDLGLRNRAAIVTGASRGIGREVARALAAEGALVLLCARDAAALAEVADDLDGRAVAGSCLASILAITSSGVWPDRSAAAWALAATSSVRVMPGTTQLLSTPSAAPARDNEVDRLSRAALAAE